MNSISYKNTSYKINKEIGEWTASQLHQLNLGKKVSRIFIQAGARRLVSPKKRAAGTFPLAYTINNPALAARRASKVSKVSKTSAVTMICTRHNKTSTRGSNDTRKTGFV